MVNTHNLNQFSVELHHIRMLSVGTTDNGLLHRSLTISLSVDGQIIFNFNESSVKWLNSSTTPLILRVSSVLMVWRLTKSWDGFRRLDWHLPTCVTCGIGEISIFQSKYEFAPFYYMEMKHAHRKHSIFVGYWYSIIGVQEGLLVYFRNTK